jgi:hypothetical protein
VLCSKGYPNEYNKNILIENFDKLNLNKGDFIYHALQDSGGQAGERREPSNRRGK